MKKNPQTLIFFSISMITPNSPNSELLFDSLCDERTSNFGFFFTARIIINTRSQTVCLKAKVALILFIFFCFRSHKKKCILMQKFGNRKYFEKKFKPKRTGVEVLHKIHHKKKYIIFYKRFSRKEKNYPTKKFLLNMKNDSTGNSWKNISYREQKL